MVCDCKYSPQLEFSTPLSGTQEVPPNLDSTSGRLTLKFAPDFSDVTYTLTANPFATLTGAHLHLGSAGTNGSILVALTTPNVTGSSSGTLLNANLTAFAIANNISTIAALYDQIRQGRLYVNIHNGTFPGGVARGQVYGKFTV